MKIHKPKLKGLLTTADLQAIGDLMGGLMDRQAAVLASKQDLKEVKQDLEKVKENMATKTDLADLESNLKDYMHEGFESVMEGMDIIMGLLPNDILPEI